MVSAPIDPLTLGQRISHLLTIGRREATYKLATLLALVDICVEHPQISAADGLFVPFDDLAERVIGSYWRQSREYSDSGVLRQTKSERSLIVDRIAELRRSIAVNSVEQARTVDPAAFRRLVVDVGRHVARYPLTHLQHVGIGPAGAQGDDFLFDATGLRKKMTVDQIERMGGVTLRPGVAFAMASVAPLLRPVIELLWVEDVERMNRPSLESSGLAQFLFGADRLSLSVVVPILREFQNDRCFYCEGSFNRLRIHVDHVIPWSRIPLDGVANLVLADDRCNLDKGHSLPVVEAVDRSVRRDPAVLRGVATAAGLPVLAERTRDAAAGIYRFLPDGSPLWRGQRDYDTFDRAALDILWPSLDVENEAG